MIYLFDGITIPTTVETLVGIEDKILLYLYMGKNLTITRPGKQPWNQKVQMDAL